MKTIALTSTALASLLVLSANASLAQSSSSNANLVAAQASPTTAADLIPQPPIDEKLAIAAKAAYATIFEWSDFGGAKAHASARVTREDAKEWCGAWQPNDADCTDDTAKDNSDRVYSLSANCQTGELWSVLGDKYDFEGAVFDDKFWNQFAGYGYLAFKDDKTGKRVGMDNASGGGILAQQWLTLCPLGTPYNRQPVQRTNDPIGKTKELEMAGSSLVLDIARNTISYDKPSAELGDAVKKGDILFRGWLVKEGYITGVAYAYAKDCKPAPYLVSGYDQYSDRYSLSGNVPVFKGCEIVGHSKTTLEISKSKKVPKETETAAMFDHNGSRMNLDMAGGTITYVKPKNSISGTIKPGDILFDGSPWTEHGAMTGTAYVFKKGCTPAAYHVEGGYDASIPGYVLKGKAPIRAKKGCDVTGFSADSANARLVFAEGRGRAGKSKENEKFDQEAYIRQVYETESDPNWEDGFIDDEINKRTKKR